MPIELTSLSQSSLQDYYDCQRRFELRYLQRLAYPAIETEPALENEKHQREGEYFHRLVQQYFIGIPAEQVARLTNSDNLQRWWENFSNSKDLTGLRDLSGLKTEVTLSAPLGAFRLVAKYDLIAAHKDKFYIYDWKTYRKRPKSEFLGLRWQTRVYRALLVRAGAFLNQNQPIHPEQVEMVYWFSDFPNDPARFPYQADQFKRDWDALTRIAEEIKNASNYPKTNDTTRCLYCPYRSYCLRGAKAGDALDVELETETEELFDINFEQIGEIEF
ncbi:MAG TPA: PD-(D/E)XK nuclease family protein [Anaerolineales bacterium]|nr:PD-(D/E)XK nuclease family protein [Anaerolineales bacterium]HNA88210.1 PD-(D/E)XK nuclease family protein [Anaerolineales bacterium]